MLREALSYIVGLGNNAEKVQVLEICGETYANKHLERYGAPKRANAIEASSLSSMVDYITECADEFPEGRKMVIWIVNPETVHLMSTLDREREREHLFTSKAEISQYRFDYWYDQERFMIEIQSNFVQSADRDILVKFAGNVEQKNNATYSDDGKTQVATMSTGVASKSDVIVPNPVYLAPYRTFQEIEQPFSNFVFRMGDKVVPAFSLIEAEGGLWKNEAVNRIKEYFRKALEGMPESIRERIVIIG
jgi:hypothetical protein